MNKQELLKQADYTFQRGNHELAKKYLADYLSAYPNDEAAWMLMARMTNDNARKADCYQRVLKINPGNNEARIGLHRVNVASPTLPRPVNGQYENPWEVSKPYRSLLRGTVILVVLLLVLGTSTYAIARNNPQSNMAQLIIPPTPTLFVQSFGEDVAAETRAEVSEQYPQYAPLVDAVLGLAVNSANAGMDGAPERPGAEIISSQVSGEQARTLVEKSLPQPGVLASVTLNEQQVTSWLVMELQNSPDLPLQDVQVYLRDGKIQIWGMVQGTSNSTSALIVGKLSIDSNAKPYIDIESMQVGTQTVPELVISQMEAWLNQMLSQKIEEQVPGLELMNVNVSNGLITVSGMR